MNIICDPERMPGEKLLAKMEEGAVHCVQSEGIDPQRVEVSLIFVSGEEIRELNNLYRGVDKVTDVLSFPQYEDLNELPQEGEIPLGDVVVCTEQALIQADEFGHSNERELVYLFVHSTLHLLGYDHIEEGEKSQMRAKEEAIMSQIQVER